MLGRYLFLSLVMGLNSLTAATAVAGRLDITQVLDCARQLGSAPPIDGAIVSILERDGLTIEKLRERGVKLGQWETWLYEPMPPVNGKFVIKRAWGLWGGGANQNPAVAAYLVNRRLGFQLLPQTEEIILNGQRYSAQKYIESPQVSVRDRHGKRTLVPIAQVASNPMPNEVLLFDAICGNLDREMGGHNYLLLSDDATAEWGEFVRNRTVHLRNARWILYDQAIGTVDLAAWLERRRRGSAIDDKRIKSVFSRGSAALQKLSDWKTAEIRAELGPYLSPENVDAFLVRRKAILKQAKLR